MDRVPNCFIEEVLLLLDYERYGCSGDAEVKRLPSIWGQIVNSKRPKEYARLDVYLRNDKEAFFLVWNRGKFLKLPNLEQFTISQMFIWDGHEGVSDGSVYHPLKETNFKLLRRQLARGHAFTMCLESKGSHALVDRLRLVPPRIVELKVFNLLPSSVEALTRSVDRGTLRSLESFGCLTVTHEHLQVLLNFVASEQLEHFSFKISVRSPVSYSAVLTEVVNAFLSRNRAHRFKFIVDAGAMTLPPNDFTAT
uniref:F-box domain-containing protein n=1 Tax=Steinernema glaseri TaxID=37863 RepID=A0A1I7ZQN5_9BILA